MKLKFRVRIKPTEYVLKIENMEHDMNDIEFRDDAERLLAWLYAGLPSGTFDSLANLMGLNDDQIEMSCAIAKKVIKIMESKQAERR